MKDIPLLFQGAMVRAVLSESKNQTRRTSKLDEINKHPDRYLFHAFITDKKGNNCACFWDKEEDRQVVIKCPYGKTGDHLWVKETHLPKASGIIYKADYDPIEAAGLGWLYGGWKPSIFCRREYSRIILEVVNVRVERLNEISEGDAKAEGIESHHTSQRCNLVYRDYSQTKTDVSKWFSSPINSYRSLWESINGAGSWPLNPWVWVVEFGRIK